MNVNTVVQLFLLCLIILQIILIIQMIYINRKRRKLEIQDSKPITREELKNLIRIFPFVEIGKQFNVSDNAIRKWCKLFSLPFKKEEIKKYTDKEWELL